MSSPRVTTLWRKEETRETERGREGGSTELREAGLVR